ncbi:MULTISPECIES: DMT family transporter [unclassified Lentimicrobium]|uniref:DMT family transporter n=1 Tax=unclassified Lentimicrobium TaxID=2677434 RepID=UPI001552A952|nr:MULTISPECIES: DMT family transporter [unclassified Lentimicrobium]NPD43989.1 DMT family transporter [Lentimicrobium sp. S6]NPD84098.1 DMT family transporter [Lentimicrobium sp. L6]
MSDKKNEIQTNNKLIGFAFALLATALWSGNFVVARGWSAEIHPFSLAFYRWTVAVLVFTPFALNSVRRDWKAIRAKLPYLAITALLGVSTFNTLIYFAGRSTTAINLSLIALTFPIFILILSSLLFKEKITLKKSLGILIVLVGVLSIISQGQLSRLLQLSFHPGDPLMLMAAFTFSIHSMLLKRKPAAISVISLQYMTFLIGLVILLPFYLVNKSLQTEPEIITMPIFASILYIGICASLISFVSWNKAIEKIGAPSAGMIYFLLPLFSGIAAWVFLGEHLQVYHFISAFLIVTGIMIGTRNIRAK